MSTKRIVLALVYLISICVGVSGLNQDQVNVMKNNIIVTINDLKVGRGFQRIGGYVRVAFHDCVGGLCDGCLNLKDPNNAGLDAYVAPLEPVYAKHKDLLSRADFWQLAGITAIERSYAIKCKRCIKPELVFKTGRKDCPTSPDYNGLRVFPMGGGHADIDSVMTFLENSFGLARTEPWLGVALMGAHSLGEAHASASGWSGKWTINADGLTNKYYELLLKPKWTQIDINEDPDKEPIYQWLPGKGQPLTSRRGKKRTTFMLNADIVLAKHLATDESGKASCEVSTDCPEQSETVEWVRTYAKDTELWKKNFAIAYMRMITSGYKEEDFEDVTK